MSPNGHRCVDLHLQHQQLIRNKTQKTYCGTGKITAIVFWYEMHMDVEGAIDSQVSFLFASRSLQEFPFFYGGDVILTNWPESIPHLPYEKVHWVIAL